MAYVTTNGSKTLDLGKYIEGDTVWKDYWGDVDITFTLSNQDNSVWIPHGNKLQSVSGSRTADKTYEWDDDEHHTQYKDDFIHATHMFEEIAKISFSEIKPETDPQGNQAISGANLGVFILDNMTNAFFTGGSATLPNPSVDALGIHTINLNGNTLTRDSEFGGGSERQLVILHELGHAMGLQHPHEGLILPTELDTSRNSVMSYKDGFGNGNYDHGQAVSLMAFDIAALQHMYGANYNTRNGDTTYELLGEVDTSYSLNKTNYDGTQPTFLSDEHIAIGRA